MQAMVLYETGFRSEAILLAASKNRLRLILRDGNDTIELRRIHGQWVLSDGASVEFEFIIAADETEGVPFCSPVRHFGAHAA